MGIKMANDRKRKDGNLRAELVLRENEDAALIEVAEELLAKRKFGETVRGVLTLATLCGPDSPLERIAAALETIAAQGVSVATPTSPKPQSTAYAKALEEL